MKSKILHLFSFLIIFSVSSLLFGQTTQEEYNYITKGYKIQTESGLDMKKGYSFVDYGNWGLSHGTEKRRCTFSGLMRDGETKPCAVMMIYNRTDITNGAVYYLCLPSADASDEIWNQTLTFINTNFMSNTSMMETVIWALMKFSSEQIMK